jgi:hypothetical protein
MALHVLISSVCLSVDVYMVDFGGITWVPHYLIASFHLGWALFLL